MACKSKLRCGMPAPMRSRQPRLNPDLGNFLGSLQKSYHQKQFLSSDPLEFVHRYQDPFDQEAVALISALLAYGNVKQIRRSVEDAIRRMRSPGPASGPAAFVRSLGNAAGRSEAQAAFSGFVHRFNRGEDIVILFALLARSWERYGSLGAHFLSYLEPNAPDVSLALSSLIEDWRRWIASEPVRASSSVDYLLTSPKDGSCCKRWCMFLRWMGRKDELDPGLWTHSSPLRRTFPEGRALEPRQLVIPLDTHTGRISQYLGLTRRKSLNWKAAIEVTRSLASCDPSDPTRYDFAISRLGILSLCQRRYRAEICAKCQLVPACKFARLAR